MSNLTPGLIPSVEEVMERAEQKKKVKFLNSDNSWNTKGILEAYDESEDTMTKCSASGVPLFYTSRNGQVFQLESFGYCTKNGKPYHVDHLALSEHMIKSSYPIEYEGCYSLEEWEKPLTMEEEKELKKAHGF